MWNYIRRGFILWFIVVVKAQIHGPSEVPRDSFDQQLYESVLDPELCRREMLHMVLENQMLWLQLLDAGPRIPTGVFQGSTNHLGNYFQCLSIREESLDPPIQGKYCSLKVPLNQSLEFPPGSEYGDVNGRQLLADEIRKRGKDPEVLLKALEKSGENGPTGFLEFLSAISYRYGICIPQTCSTEEWVASALSSVGFEFEEVYCRLPNDKPWVAADWVATVIFSLLTLITLLSTCYDLHCTFTLKKDPKQMNPYFRIFSVYTNARRLTTFTKSSDALECLDGIRSLSMMWVIIGHTFSMYNHFTNLLDVIDFLVSGPATLIQTGVYAVDTFFTIAGILLVYTSVGKMTSRSLLRGLHAFYLNRIFRLFPLLAAIVLLEASFFHRIADGPYWLTVARNTERCRTWWWTTLLYVQNYVNPDDICIAHSWYLAIDMQIHIISPLVLYWVLSGKKKVAWTALFGGILTILTASTIFNFFKDMPSSNASIVRLDEQSYYMNNFYQNTLTRASSFFFGMALGYLLTITKGKKIKMNWVVVIAMWMLSLAMFAVIFYYTYEIMQLDWDNQIFDNFYNSFGRPIWSLALSWVIFACIHGYGGPVNWLLSHQMWKLPSRISYAMYLFHYSFMFIAAGMQLSPIYFTPAQSLFDFIGHFTLAFVVSFCVTVLIDAPFSTVTKLIMGGGPKKKRPPPPIEAKPSTEAQIENGTEVDATDKKE
ncbi:O-acyltransferase like protein-like [Zerene cesonia]|uniref:O-acyltransferase like protein-like n=1 Tax=Zerene cesonia TaxID=33412 RepID=UPI0018E567AF|nr:O-acyltransferase like protein-like [Zerene cesonia]